MNVPISFTTVSGYVSLMRALCLGRSNLHENAGEVGKILSDYYEQRHNDGSTDLNLIDTYTRGHLKRGVE